MLLKMTLPLPLVVAKITRQQYADLAKGQGFEPVQKIGVNPMTLKALVRERLESGKEVPEDLFKPFEGNQTKITRRN